MYFSVFSSLMVSATNVYFLRLFWKTTTYLPFFNFKFEKKRKHAYNVRQMVVISGSLGWLSRKSLCTYLSLLVFEIVR